MKPNLKFHSAIFVSLFLFCIQSFAQHTYLVNRHAPEDSHKCEIYKYNGPSSEKIEMAGGEVGYGGFNFWDEGAFVTFRLGGQYEKLSFLMGQVKRCSNEVGAVTVLADGKKIFDEKIRGFDPPKHYVLDVSGVDEIKFTIVASYLDLAVANAILWKKGQTPVDIRRTLPKAKTAMLTKDLKAYYVSNFMEEITPESEDPLIINRQKYEYGIRGSMNMALIGVNKGYAYYNLRKQYSKLSFIAGCRDDVTGRTGSGWVTVKADNKIIEEIEIKEGEIARQFILDISGCESLSFHTEQISGDSYAEIAEIMVYPEGEAVAVKESSGGLAPPDPRLKTLPDACKLISNIEPYTAISSVKKQIYDGTSDYITFSMGGTKFSEGFILYDKVSFFNDDPSSSVTFDVGNEFDYISFTTGYVGKSWNMNDDYLLVYADEELVFSTKLIPTYPNQQCVVPIKKCRTLKFANIGCGSMDVAAFGVADIVAYRGEPVENDLFVHPVPECPYEIDLIDLGAPYIHYVSMMSDHKDEILRDGSTKKLYYEVNGERIYKGFVLQTSTHFSLDFGVLGNKNSADAAAAGAVGAIAAGASFVASGIAVGGAAVGATVAPLGAFLMLAAGGEAVENSLAAFNTYGEYNSVTFKVACLSTSENKSDTHEHLMIGADHNVVANIGVYESMEPQEVTVPIDGCRQLIFWLANTNGTSEKYVIYDIVVSKDRKPLEIALPARMSLPVIQEVITSDYPLSEGHERAPSSFKSRNVDIYLSSADNYYRKLQSILKSYKSDYKIYTYYLDSSEGPCKAVTLRPKDNAKRSYDMIDHYNYLVNTQLKTLEDMLEQKSELVLENVNANASLIELGLEAVKYRKYIKEFGTLMKECFDIVERFHQEKLQEALLIKSFVNNALVIDGVSSTDDYMICPVTAEDKIPEYQLQHITYFDLIE